MGGFIADLLKECSAITGMADTPATASLFDIDPASAALEKAEREDFHSLVAKLLYLAKRARPDILVSVSFLASRVLVATAEDKRKVERIVRYIRATSLLGITLEASKFVAVIAYVDASYGVHADFKSQTGATISIGKGPVFAASSKQKLMTKSSTEAELVALSDYSGQALWLRNFLIAQGLPPLPATMKQDNESTMALIKNGKSNSQRTRHIAIRYFWVSDRVASGEIKVEYLCTDDMLADVLTKPLTGDKFRKMRDLLLNVTV
jgi:hypothetical protein